MNNRNKIDELFREAMTGYRVEPSVGLWRRIEWRLFPPSKFRPSGIITSILLLVVAGLMPWVLIPANDQEQKKPGLIAENSRQGYLIEPAAREDLSHQGTATLSPAERAFSVKPTIYHDNPADMPVDPAEQFIASINDPAEDPAIQPILNSYQLDYALSRYEGPDHQASPVISFADTRIIRMTSKSSGDLDNPSFIEDIVLVPEKSPVSAFSPDYENSYLKKVEFSAGMDFNPSIVFYDPNPYNQMLSGEATFQAKFSAFSINTGIGFSSMADIGSYKINYVTNDSVGYYLRVVSFILDPMNPGQVTFVTVQEPIYDSVPHYTIADKTNHYSYLDLPLSFGYKFLEKNRLSLTANMGVKFSVLVGKQEPTVDFWIPEAELIDIERQVPSRMNTTWRFTAGVDFGYLLSNRISVHLEPAFEQYITPVYASQPGYKPRKPYVIGLKAGVRYNF